MSAWRRRPTNPRETVHLRVERRAAVFGGLRVTLGSAATVGDVDADAGIGSWTEGRMTDISRRAFIREASIGAGAVIATQVVPPGVAAAAQTSPTPRASALAHFATPGDADFPKVGGNLGNQNYAGLSAINPGNIRSLGGAWSNRLEGGVAGANSQSTAVAVDGVLYIESPQGHVFAVDGVTGATKWKYEQTGGALTRRGVAVADGRVFTLGRTNRVIALDKDTGQVVWDRQHDGFGNIQKVALVYHAGRLLVGTNDGARGAALAFDASNGDLRWHFWGAPRHGTSRSGTEGQAGPRQRGPIPSDGAP